MTHTLTITPGGAAELRCGRALLWNSASDEAFADEFPDPLTVDDFEGVLEYLVEEDYLTDEEADAVECEEEDLEGEQIEETENSEEEDDPHSSTGYN